MKLGQFDAYTGGQNRGFSQKDRRQEQNGTAAEVENDSQTGDIDTSDGLGKFEKLNLELGSESAKREELRQGGEEMPLLELRSVKDGR